MLLFFVLVAVWFLFGILSLLILKEEDLPASYRVFLVMEGLVGLLFIILFRDAFVKNKK